MKSGGVFIFSCLPIRNFNGESLETEAITISTIYLVEIQRRYDIGAPYVIINFYNYCFSSSPFFKPSAMLGIAWVELVYRCAQLALSQRRLEGSWDHVWTDQLAMGILMGILLSQRCFSADSAQKHR